MYSICPCYYTVYLSTGSLLSGDSVLQCQQIPDLVYIPVDCYQRIKANTYVQACNQQYQAHSIANPCGYPSCMLTPL